MNETELRTLIAKSREEGFRELLRQYQKYVFSIVWQRLRAVGTIEDAKECMSDIFAHIFLCFNEINEGTLRGFIAAVSERTAIDKFRSLSSRHSSGQDEEELALIPDDTDIQKDLETDERNRIIFEKICSLGEPDSSIIIQKYYYGRNSSDISKITGLSAAAVRKRLSRALKKLKDILKYDI